MSDPAHLFQSLQLDEMPVTRSQAHPTQQRGGRNARSSRGGGRGRARVPPPSIILAQISPPGSTPVQSYTGRQYYTQALSPTSAQRATEGLESNFCIDRVQSHDSGRERYFAFQLRTPVAVRIYEPTGGRARMECSCEAHRVTRSECAHIFWLFAGLHAVLTDQQVADTQVPVQIEMPLTSQLGRLYPLIEQRQASLRQDLNQIRGEDIESDADGQDPFSSIDMDIRTEILCDIMSSFDRDMIPAEFKHHFVDYPSPGLSPVSHSSLVRGSLPATVYHLACRDDAFYRCLQELVPPDVRATQYHQTQNLRAESALRRLSQYAETGPSAQQASDRNIDVPECARQLRYIVYSVCEDRDTRIAVAPLSLLVLRRLAEMLARLVVQVVSWDKDIYEGTSWNRNQPLNEHSRERNLFIYLIGDPPVDPTLPHWMTDKFVIDRLRGYPPGEWSHLLELFTSIKDSIEEMNMDNVPGSFAYVATIDDMVQYYTATVYEPSSSSAQPRRA